MEIALFVRRRCIQMLTKRVGVVDTDTEDLNSDVESPFGSPDTERSYTLNSTECSARSHSAWKPRDEALWRELTECVKFIGKPNDVSDLDRLLIITSRCEGDVVVIDVIDP